MKKQLFAALLTVIATTFSYAQVRTPILIGDAVLKDELIILNKSIVCSAWGAPTPADGAMTKPEDLFQGTYTVGLAKENGDFMVNGLIDGDSFQMHGSSTGTVNVSLTRAASEKSAALSVSSSSSYTKEVIRGAPVQIANLTVMLDGKIKTISCSFKK